MNIKQKRPWYDKRQRLVVNPKRRKWNTPKAKYPRKFNEDRKAQELSNLSALKWLEQAQDKEDMNTDIQISWRTDDGFAIHHISRFDLLYITQQEYKPSIAQLRKELVTTEQEQRYADFFSQGYKAGLDVEQKTLPELQKWIKELEATVEQARAILHGADLAYRERSAKLDLAEREKLRSQVDSRTFNVADSTATVKKRAERQTKMDKLVEHLKDLGLDEAAINETVQKTKFMEEVPQVTKPKVNGQVDKKLSIPEQLAQAMLDAEKKKNEPKPPSIVEDDPFFS